MLARFNPANQTKFCADVQRAYFGTAPRLGVVAGAFGRNIAEAWLMAQLTDLSEFAGAKDKLTAKKLEELAVMIAADYPHYKLTEFMLFFQRFKRCAYGKFYGSVDPMVITGALAQFHRERCEVYEARRREQMRTEMQAAEERTEQERLHLRRRYIARVPGAFTSEAPITFSQYRRLKLDALTDVEMAALLSDIATGNRRLTSAAEASDPSALHLTPQPSTTQR